MSTISLRLPDSLHQEAKKEAKKDHISINQLVTTALAEKLSALKTADYLSHRAKNAPSRKLFKKIMSRAPDVIPEEKDRF